MENNQNESKLKKHGLKIIIPILIVIVIAGIWFTKNQNKVPTKIEANLDKSPTTTESNPDFALHVTKKLDMEKLKSYGVPIIIDFGADSCIPCKEMAPVLEKLNQDLKGKAIIKFVDVWKYPELAQEYPLSVIPTQVFFDQEGKPYTPADAEGAQMKTYSSKDGKDHTFTTHEGKMTEEMILAVLKEMGMKDD